MLRTIRKRGLFLLAGLFCLLFAEQGLAESMTAEKLVAAINQKGSGIQDFQADMTASVWKTTSKTIQEEITVWQKGKLLRVEMALPSEMLPPTDRTVGSPKMLTVFDGKTMWQLMPTMNMVTKIDFSALEDTEKEVPFSKPPYLLPVIPYQMSEESRDGIDCYLLEPNDPNEFIQKSCISTWGNMKTKSAERISIWVNKATLFPELIELYSQGIKPAMSVKFRNIKINQGLSPNLFVFQVPEGAQMMDITAAMKAKYEKMEKQSTATDTTQAQK